MASESEDRWRGSFSLILCQVFIKQRKYNFYHQQHLRCWHNAVGCPEEEKEPSTAPPGMIHYRPLGHASFYLACYPDSESSLKEGHRPSASSLLCERLHLQVPYCLILTMKWWHLKEEERSLYFKFFLLGCMNNFEIKIWGSGEMAQVDNMLAVQTQRPEIGPTLPM